MSNKNKLLTVLSDAEQEALYGLPDFDDAQRLDYLALTEAELTFASTSCLTLEDIEYRQSIRDLLLTSDLQQERA